MIKLMNGLLSLLLLCFGISCSKTIESDPLVRIQEIGPFRYEIRYLPNAIISASEGKDPGATHPSTESGHQHFLLNIQMVDKQPVEQYLGKVYGDQQTAILNHLRFQLQADFQLKIGNTVLPCVLYHLETTPFKHQGLNFNLVFRDDVPDRTFPFAEITNFQFQDRILGGVAVNIPFQFDPPISSNLTPAGSYKF